MEVAKYQVKILLICFYVFSWGVYNDGDSFSPVFMVCGNMNLLVVEARLKAKGQGFSNL
jgi:hypothetical protein